MKPDKIIAAYFSPTGTTAKVVEHVARGLASSWGIPCETFDWTLPDARAKVHAFDAGSLVVFATPTYAGRVPNVLLPYLAEKIQGNGALALPVVLFGNRNYDDALMELRGILEADGFHTVGGAAFVGEHSFSHILGAGRPDAQDMALAEGFAKTVFARVDALDAVPSEPAPVGGEDPIRPYYTPRDRHGEPINILKVKPKVNEACVKCGLCAKTCPMGSIDPEDVTQYIGICIKCGSCSKKCPKEARFYDDAGYLYHRTELEEMYERRAEPALF